MCLFQKYNSRKIGFIIKENMSKAINKFETITETIAQIMVQISRQIA